MDNDISVDFKVCFPSRETAGIVVYKPKAVTLKRQWILRLKRYYFYIRGFILKVRSDHKRRTHEKMT